METTQIIKLNEDERETLNKAFKIIDLISDTVHCSMGDVFRYLSDNSNIVGSYEYRVDEILQIADMRG